MMLPTRTSTTWEAFSTGIVRFYSQLAFCYSHAEEASSPYPVYAVYLRCIASDKGGNTTQQ
jgi:hypothetical protein